MESPQPSNSIVTHVQVQDEGHASGDDYPSLLRNIPNEVLSDIFSLCSCSRSVPLPYDQDDVPYQIIVSQVCSKWRQVALSTSALWSNIEMFQEDIIKDYKRYLSLYRAWIDRAGTHPLTVTIDLSGNYDFEEQALFQDFVLPFQFKRLNISLFYEDLPQLSDFPTLNVEEFGISLHAVYRIENFAVPPFMNRTRSICLRGRYSSDYGRGTLKALCSSLPWHELRSLECHSLAVSLPALLNVLRQAQSLENCHITIHDTGSGPLVRVSMPSLRRLSLRFENVDPGIIIPLFATPNITALDLCSYDRWSSDTYDILKKHHKLHQLQEFELRPAKFPLHIAQVLADAPMVQNLYVDGKPVVDAEALEGIASGRLGCYLSSLHLGGYLVITGEWLDMIEARQRHVDAMVAQVSNWRQMITGLKLVKFGYATNSKYKERAAALKALGTTVIV
jgi:hypothetical protein